MVEALVVGVGEKSLWLRFECDLCSSDSNASQHEVVLGHEQHGKSIETVEKTRFVPYRSMGVISSQV